MINNKIQSLLEDILINNVKFNVSDGGEIK